MSKFGLHTTWILATRERTWSSVYKPEARYTPANRRAQMEGGALPIAIDAQGNVTEVEQTSDPLGEGLDESAAATESGGLSCGAGRSHRLVAHHFFLYGRAMSGRQATHRQETHPPRRALVKPLRSLRNPGMRQPRIALAP